MKHFYKSLMLLALSSVLFTDLFSQGSPCVPTFRWSWGYGRIEDVTTSGGITNISNNTGTGNNPGYKNYTAQKVQAISGTSFSVTYRATWGHGVFVDWNQDGDFGDANERISITSSSGSSPSNNTVTVNIPSGITSGSYIMRLMSIYSSLSTGSNGCGNFNEGEVEDYTLEVLSYQNSATIASVSSPSTPLCSNQSLVTVKVQNVGTQNLTSATLGGEIQTTIAGVPATIPIPDSAWTGSLTTGQTSSDYTYYNLSSGFNVGDMVTLWISNPNGVYDSLPGDDTVSFTLGTGMRGVYTIGPDTLDDFASFTDALAWADSVASICDTTWFLATDSVIYNEQLTLNDIIFNQSAQVPIILGTKDGSAGQAQIEWMQTGTGDNWVIRFGNNATGWILDDLHVKTLSTSWTGEVIYFGQNTTENMVANCTLEGVPHSIYAYTGSYQSVIADYNPPNYGNSGVENNMIIGNTILNGSYAAYFSGGGEGNVFEDNYIADQYYRYMYFYQHDELEIIGNEFHPNSPYTFGYGIYLNQCEEGFKINDNNFQPGIHDWPRYGLYIYNSTAKANAHNEIMNNSMSHGQSWSNSNYWSLYMWNTGFTDIFNNSFAQRGNSFDAYSFYINQGGATRIHNNIIANFGSGVPFRFEGTSSVISSDNNNIYASGFLLGLYNGFASLNLSGWQNNAGYDLNSVSVDPNFYEVGDPRSGEADLHSCNTALDAGGNPNYATMYDFDGDMRDANTPDIGADEFIGLGNINLGGDVVFCPGDTVEVAVPSAVVGTTVWSNGDTATSVIMTSPGTIGMGVFNQCGVVVDTISLSHPATVDIATGDTLICNGDMIMVAADLNDASYDWSSGETSQSINVNSAGKYTVEVTDKWGCVSSDSLEITLSEIAVISEGGIAKGTDTTICPGAALSLESGVSPRPGVTYVWSGYRDGSTETSNGTLILWDQTDSLIIEVNDNGCISNDKIYVDNPPNPNAVFTDSVHGWTLMLTPDEIHPRFTYDWDFGDGNRSSLPDPTYVYRNPGTYTVVLTVTTDCGSESTQSTVETVAIGLDETAFSNGVNVYPNPSTGAFNVALGVQGDFDVEVTNANGQVVYSESVSDANATSIQLNDIARGIYFVKVQMDDQVSIKKLNIQ